MGPFVVLGPFVDVGPFLGNMAYSLSKPSTKSKQVQETSTAVRLMGTNSVSEANYQVPTQVRPCSCGMEAPACSDTTEGTDMARKSCPKAWVWGRDLLRPSLKPPLPQGLGFCHNRM